MSIVTEKKADNSSRPNSHQIILDGTFAGQTTGSQHTDFYVYEWMIKETGEIFYVGKGRGNRCKGSHGDSVADKIRQLYETDIIIVAKDLSEEQAVILESSEIIRILSETNFILTNRVIPLDAVRSNFYEKSSQSTPLKFETAPTLYADEIEHHYFGVQELFYDTVSLDALGKVAFIENRVDEDLIDIVYGNNYEKYYTETIQMLNNCGATIISSPDAKSLTAWIYCGDISVSRHLLRQSRYKNLNGRNLPTFHLIDVWKYLKNSNFGLIDENQNGAEFKSNRVPLSECKKWDVFDFEGNEIIYQTFAEAEKLRKSKEYEAALKLLDVVRQSGYISCPLYISYAKIFRVLKDYDNEIDIINEGIYQYKIIGNTDAVSDLLSRKRKAEEKRSKLKG